MLQNSALPTPRAHGLSSLKQNTSLAFRSEPASEDHDEAQRARMCPAMKLLSDLRKEQMHSRHPDRHVFRITSEQEREIIQSSQGLIDSSAAWGKPVHIATLFGCRVEVVD